MLYFLKTTESQLAFIPKGGPEPAEGAELVLSLVSTVNHTEVFDAQVQDLNIHRLYYRVAVTLPSDAQEGEYEYRLRTGGEVLAQGVAVVGGPAAAATENENIIQYEQTE